MRRVVLFIISVCVCPSVLGVEARQPDPDEVRLTADATAIVSQALAPDATKTPDATASNPPQILLSRQLMEQAHVHAGDIVTLAGDVHGARSTRFQVVGVYEPIPDPRKFAAKRLEARLHLPDLATLTGDADSEGVGSVDAVNVALVNRQDAAQVAEIIETRAPGLVVRSTSSSMSGSDPFVVLDRFQWAIAVVTVIGSTAFLLALMVMRAEERRDVIGILRLMGIPRRSILVEVLFEGLLIAMSGAIFGVIVAAAGEGLVNRFFQWRYDTTLVFVRVTLPIAWKSVAFAVPLGTLAGLVASWTLLGRDVTSLVGR